MYRRESAGSKMLSLQARLCLSPDRWRGCLDGFADIPPTGEVPRIWKVFALLWFHSLNRALVPLQEKTGPIRPVDQGQPASVRAQASIILNKGIFLHPEMGGDRTDFIFRHPYETGPTATGRAALAEIGGRHSRKNELWIMNYEELNLFLSS